MRYPSVLVGVGVFANEVAIMGIWKLGEEDQGDVMGIT
jgi:hypothetical protein